VNKLEKMELYGFIQYLLKDPRNFAISSKYYFERVWIRVLRKSGFERCLYPEYLRIITRNNMPRMEKVERTTNAELYRGMSDDFEYNRKIRLADGWYNQNVLDLWTTGSDDPEVEMSLHRFNWLLYEITETSKGDNDEIGRWGLTKISEWINRNMYKQEIAIQNPYTISERITNSILFCLSTSGMEHGLQIPSWLRNALGPMAISIVGKLEHDKNDAGNHILNNARALYFYGCISGESYFKDVAQSIFQVEIRRLITDEGFLRESSSHYHFLVARWLLEVLYLSKVVGDKLLYELIRPVCSKMIRRTWFFLILNKKDSKWHIPLFGDVSPDFSPDWLISLPWSVLALESNEPTKVPLFSNSAGWSSLFGLQHIVGNTKVADRKRSYSAFRKAGWYRLDYGRFTIFWHFEAAGIPVHPNHGHCDTGSFALYVDGLPVIIDIGRSRYNVEGEYAITARAHNSVQIDDVSPFVYNRKYPLCYRRAQVGIEWEETERAFVFIIEHLGFKRLWNITIKRIFNICDERLFITDEISGSGKRKISTYFHFDPKLNICIVEKGMVKLTSGGCIEIGMKLNPLPNCKMDIIDDVFSPEYGNVVKTQALKTESVVTLPYSHKWALELM
jgi:heparinase II/III-like protein